MRIKALGLAAVLVLSTALSTQAATTAEDAAKLQATLQSYFGGAANVIKIAPDGDGFKASLDLTPYADKIKESGAEMSMTPLDMHLQPEGDGKWKLSYDGPFKVTFKSKDGTVVEEAADNYKFDAEFDEALVAFTTQNGSATNITFTEALIDSNGMAVNAKGKFDTVTFSGTGAANSAGGVDMKINEKFGPLALDESVTDKDQPPVNIHATADSGNFDINIDGARTKEALPLLKFAVDHQDDASAAKDQAMLKDQLMAILPVFNAIGGQGSFEKVQVQTPLGLIAVDKVSGGGLINGVVQEGKLNETLSFEGIVLPPGLVPSWATSLVPKNVALGVTVTGYNTEAAVKAWITALDLTKTPSVPDDIENQLAAFFLPKGSVDITFEKSSINNDTYAFTAEGSMAAGPSAQPTGKAHITAKGLDDILAAVQAAPPEAGLQGGPAIIIAAKGLGKAQGDGSLAWDVEATPDGKLTINGIDVNKVAPQQ